MTYQTITRHRTQQKGTNPPFMTGRIRDHGQKERELAFKMHQPESATNETLKSSRTNEMERALEDDRAHAQTPAQAQNDNHGTGAC